MFLVSASCGHLKARQAATPVLIGSPRFVPEGCRFTRLSRHFVWVAKALSFFRLCLAQTLQFSLALSVVPLRLASVPAQRWRSQRCPAQFAGSVSSGACGGSSTALHFSAVAHGMHRLPFSRPAWYRACFTHVHQTHAAKPCRITTVTLTRRSTSLLSVAGRCAIKPRSAG